MKRQIVMAILITLATCGAALAQPSNFHVAGVIEGSDGFAFPILGVSVGGDWRASPRFSLTTECAFLLHAHKSAYGDGRQFDCRAITRTYVNKKWFIQFGGNVAHTEFNHGVFHKTTLAPLAGVGLEDGNQLYGIDYRHDVLSENKQRALEASYRVYAKKHVYARLAGGVTSFIDGTERKTGGFFRFETGAWFR